MFQQIVLFALAIASVSANLSFTDCGKWQYTLHKELVFIYARSLFF